MNSRIPLMLRKATERTLQVQRWLLGHLSRETSSGRFIPVMDGLRFVAIMMVILFHLNGYLVAKWPLHHSGFLPQSSWLAQTALVGFRGVELFFVISGFILALPFAMHHLAGGPAVSLRRYYLRRLTRLEPPYLLTVVVLFMLAVLVRGQSTVDLLPHFAASLVYLHNIVYARSSPVIGVAWSLEIEVQFYLLVPLLTFVFAIRNKTYRRALLVTLIIAFSCAQQLFLGDSRLALSILAYLQFFLSGFLLADLFITDWKEAATTNFSADVITLIGWPLMIAILQSDRLTFWLLPFMLLFLYRSAFRGSLSRRIFSNQWITAVGGMCYSIYLIHYEVISLIGRFTSRLGADHSYCTYFALQFLLIAVPITGICGLYFVIMERPCMSRDWPQRLRNNFQVLFCASRREPQINAAA